MKCVAQMPKPVEMAETVNHMRRMRPWNYGHNAIA